MPVKAVNLVSLNVLHRDLRMFQLSVNAWSWSRFCVYVWVLLGKPVRTKMDEFLENLRTAFDPPPHSGPGCGRINMSK